MNNITIRTPYTNELYHHGIKGQKWGVRRYQNPDGSLTDEGKKRYGEGYKGITRRKVDEDISDAKSVGEMRAHAKQSLTSVRMIKHEIQLTNLKREYEAY